MNRRCRPALLAHALLILIVSPAALAQDDDDAEGGRRREPQHAIWNYAAHNAFTSLVRFNGEWFCAFREGNKHASPDGGIRILRSIDEQLWNVAARLSDEHADLRDPKLTVTPDNRLMLTAAAATPEKPVRHRTLVWFSDDGKHWSTPKPIGDDNVWFWGITWNGDAAYGVGYSTDGPTGQRFTRLYKSMDGVKWETVVDKLLTKDFPNECSLAFDPDGTAYCLVRRDGEVKTALLGEAKPPYIEWKWKDCGKQIGGPAMTRTAEGKLIAVVRLYDNATRTAVCEVNTEDGTLTELAGLESGGDTGYAGVVSDRNVLCVSYYSSHEGKASIYFTRVLLVNPEVPPYAIPGSYPPFPFPRPYGRRR